MSRKGGKRSAEIVTRLVELGAKALVEQFEIADAQAQHVMREIAHDLARHYGGGMVYFPKDHEFALTKRDLEIYAELRSGNAIDVARKHGLSDRQVYAINRHVLDQVQRKRQNPLPGFEEPEAPI